MILGHAEREPFHRKKGSPNGSQLYPPVGICRDTVRIPDIAALCTGPAVALCATARFTPKVNKTWMPMGRLGTQAQWCAAGAANRGAQARAASRATALHALPEAVPPWYRDWMPVRRPRTVHESSVPVFRIIIILTAVSAAVQNSLA